jgi:predicted ATPase
LWDRDSELAELDKLINVASEGIGQSVVVEGPPGIGKTRLLVEGQHRARKAGYLVLAARGSELETTFAFGVVRQLFEPLLQAADRAQRTEWLAGAASQAEPIFDDGVASPPSGDFARLHGLYWLTANLAQDKPLLLVVDDLHWADTASLRFITYLLPRLEGLRLLVLTAARPSEAMPTEEGQPYQTDLLEMVLGDPTSIVLRPAPLTETAVAHLLEAAFSQSYSVEGPFVTACHTATAGNPLLLQELIKIVAAERLVRQPDFVMSGVAT